MYCSFFGLKKLPFKISPDLSFFYTQADRDDIRHAIQYSIERGDGIIKVVGEVGVGKTTLLRLLAEKLPESYRKIYISSPNLSAKDLLKFICTDLQISILVSDTKLDLMNRLNQFLLSEYAENRRVVMLIDEAQAMTLDTLEEVRLLGNLETGEDKLLQIVLFGQPELDATLNDPRVKPLKDRIACHVAIPALNAEEVMQYLNYRMRIAGYMDQDLFTLKLARRIQQLTEGLPRSINLLADKLLMVAFSKGDHRLKMQHFKTLTPEHLLPRVSSGWQTLRRIALVVLVIGAGGLAVFQFPWQLQGEKSQVETAMKSEPTQTAGLVKFDEKPVQEASSPLVQPKVLDTSTAAKSAGLRPTDLAKTLNIELSQLWQMADLQQKTEAFLQNKHQEDIFIVMSPMPISSFDKIYTRTVQRLSVSNRNSLFAIFEVDLAQKVFQYQLVYDPQVTDLAILEAKKQDLVSVSQFEYWQMKPLASLQVKMQDLKQSGNRL